jgi:hypothetical protein
MLHSIMGKPLVRGRTGRRIRPLPAAAGNGPPRWVVRRARTLRAATPDYQIFHQAARVPSDRKADFGKFVFRTRAVSSRRSFMPSLS